MDAPQSSTATPARKRRSSQVPGTYAGFSQQTFRAVVHLLRAEIGDVVSVEVLDDVATVSEHGVIVEQAKNARANPIANAAVDFWKTLANWLDAIAVGQLSVDRTSFVLSVPSGCHGTLAEAFAAATTENAASEAVEAAQRFYARKLAHDASDDTELLATVRRVFGAPAQTLASLVQRFSIVRLSGNVTEEIERGLRTKAISPPVIPTAAKQMLGWVQTQLQQQHTDGKPPAVAAEQFYIQLTAFARAYDRDRVLSGLAPPPTDDEVRAEIPRRVYIQQLAIIDATDDQQITAAADYLRAATDRALWSDEGFVHKSAFDNYEAELRQFWDSKRNTIAIAHRDRSEPERGQLVFSECCTCKPQLAGAAPPAYFSTGSLHALSDVEEIGWHPKYRDELRSRRTAARKRAS